MDADDADEITNEIMDRVREMIAPLKRQIARKTQAGASLPDAKAFGQEIAAMVRSHVAAKLEPIEARLALLEMHRTKGAKPRVRISASDWQRPQERGNQ